MTVGKRFFKALAVFALGALVSAGAIGQVTTRFTVPGGSATTSKILPGGTVSFDVRIDAPATPTIGSAFRILQTSPAAPSSFFTITARSFVGSIYNDAASGSSDALVFGLPSALLKPQNDDNLGRNTVGLVATAAGTNLFVANYTLTSNAATPLGTYRIQPTTGGTSTVTGDGPTFTDYDMSAALFDVVVGQTLTVTKSGTGTGTVAAGSGLINCGAVCSDIYPGTMVTLTATPAGGVLFLGWTGGGCSGTGPCVVTVTAATSVDAQFGFPVDGLTVTLAGTGSGTVTSVPTGINCPGTCTAGFALGTVVTLTATPAVGSVFSGWAGGGCSGAGACVVSLTTLTAVTATFRIEGDYTLAVTKAGNGTGTVTSAPSGINCGVTCVSFFAYGTLVTLTATPDAGKNFAGWSGGGCSGMGACVISLTAATAVTATFTDTIPPGVTITGGPTNPSSVANPTFTFTADEAPVTFRCSLDSGPVFACTSPTTVSVGNGNHTFTVIATDPAGNTLSASYSWVAAGIVDNTPIPTLNDWMLRLLALLVGAAGAFMPRRHNARGN